MQNLKDTTNIFHILFSCTKQAIRHPRTTIKHTSGPIPVPQSPLPWWGCSGVLVLGIITWILSAKLTIPEMGEAARLMVYAPISYLFGMSHQISRFHKQQNTGGH